MPFSSPRGPPPTASATAGVGAKQGEEGVEAAVGSYLVRVWGASLTMLVRAHVLACTSRFR